MTSVCVANNEPQIELIEKSRPSFAFQGKSYKFYQCAPLHQNTQTNVTRQPHAHEWLFARETQSLSSRRHLFPVDSWFQYRSPHTHTRTDRHGDGENLITLWLILNEGRIHTNDTQSICIDIGHRRSLVHSSFNISIGIGRQMMDLIFHWLRESRGTWRWMNIENIWSRWRYASRRNWWIIYSCDVCGCCATVARKTFTRKVEKKSNRLDGFECCLFTMRWCTNMIANRRQQRVALIHGHR